MNEIGNLLKKYLTSVQIEKGNEYTDFYKSWKSIAGEKIANNSTIKDIEDGFLIIEIDHPGWKQLIKLNEKSIIKKINSNYPALEVKNIKYFFINKPTKTVVIEEKIKKVENNLKNIENTEFNELLKKMSKRSEV